jgi:hypothetical protein
VTGLSCDGMLHAALGSSGRAKQQAACRCAGSCFGCDARFMSSMLPYAQRMHQHID